jgi:hypothetical protein
MSYQQNFSASSALEEAPEMVEQDGAVLEMKESIRKEAIRKEGIRPEEMMIVELSLPKNLENIREWLREKKDLLESDWMKLPVGDPVEVDEASGRSLKRIPKLSNSEENTLISALRSKGEGYQFLFAMNRESFERTYKENIFRLQGILDECDFAAVYLENLLREIQQRLFLIMPSYDTVVYYSSSRQLVMVWSTSSTDELYKKMRALS